MEKQKIGSFSQEVIELLELKITAGTPIYIGSSNIEHIKSRHPYECEKYFPYISDIISAPSYVGRNPSNQSISFVKFFQYPKDKRMDSRQLSKRRIYRCFSEERHLCLCELKRKN